MAWIRFLMILSGVITARAGNEPTFAAQSGEPDQFHRGALEFNILAGPMFSFDSGKPVWPSVNMAITHLQFGWMVTAPRFGGLFPGNNELVIDALAGGIFHGPGNYVTGANLLLRRNFLFKSSFVVPYAQLGGGGSYSDIARDQSQHLLGSNLNFSAEFGIGLRFLISKRCSFMLEHDFWHLSNFGLTARNHGLDSIGGQAGLAFSF